VDRREHKRVALVVVGQVVVVSHDLSRFLLEWVWGNPYHHFLVSRRDHHVGHVGVHIYGEIVHGVVVGKHRRLHPGPHQLSATIVVEQVTHETDALTFILSCGRGRAVVVEVEAVEAQQQRYQ
jgi:hypothetical protein